MNEKKALPQQHGGVAARSQVTKPTHWRFLLGFLLCLFYAPSLLYANAVQKTTINPTKVQTILVFGDSLSAAYNLPVTQGWVALTAARLKGSHPKVNLINASVSGETTAGGFARLPSVLQKHKPQLVLIQLGANDGLRGLPLTQTENNLRQMIQLCKKSGAKVLLIGIRLPPNFGARFTQQFFEIYRTLAVQEKTSLLPFLLEPIAEDRQWFLADQIHPNAKGQVKLRDHVWPHLKPLL